MTTTNKTNHVIKFAFALVIALCLSVFCQLPISFAKVHAVEVASNQIEITNGDFDSSSTTVLQSTPNGWSKVGSSTGKNGIIDASEKTFSNSSRTESYALSSTQRPTTANPDFDTYMLMLNAKSKIDSNESNHVGYKSNNLTLDAYSFYKISIFTLTQENAVASMYITGLDDKTENVKFERYSAPVWTEYRYYIATGNKDESVTIELWLGSKDKDSMNAVFFDHVTMNKISGSYFYEEAGHIIDKLNDSSTTEPEKEDLKNTLKRNNIIDLRDFEEGIIENANFEKASMEGWTAVDHRPIGGASKIISINQRDSMESLGLSYLGSSLSPNNNYSFLLYTTGKDKVSMAYESTAFKVKPYETLKITVWAKISQNLDGSAYIKLQEQDDVKNFYKDSPEFYTPVVESVKIASNPENIISNGYNPYTFYVKGHELFETSFKLQLCLGKEDEKASGAVVFDDITFEKISWEQFNNAGTSDTAKVELTSVKTNYTVNNGAFNFATGIGKEVAYPVNPLDWTHTEEDKAKSMFGIINTYSPIYEASKANFGGIKNPENPSTAGNVNVDANNMLMLYNSQQTYQSVTSSSLSVAKQTYQRVSFDYKTVQQEPNHNLMNVYILDDDNNILYSEENLYAENWTHYSLLIRSTEYTSSIKLVIGLGNKDEKVKGYVFVDNAEFATDEHMTDELYKEYVKTHKTLDFTVTNFNFVSPTQTNGMFTPYKYTQELVAGTPATSGNDIAYGGIIDGSSNIFGITNSPNNKETLKYMPAFTVDNIATYTLTAKDSLTLDSDKYYKFSVEVYTRFNGDLKQEGVKEEDKAKFGAIFGLKGIDKEFTTICSNDKWTTYTIYVALSSSKDVNLKFGITTESTDILGQVFFDNFKFESIDESIYNKAIAQTNNDKTVLSITKDDIKEEDKEEDKEDTTTKDNALIWYLIPSLILFAALVIAVVAYYMKKVTIKKWERKKASDYDRGSTLHRDVIRQEAEEVRDSKIKETQKQIDDLNDEIARIEEIHKENVKAQKQSTGTLARSVERDFKAYAKRHTSLENKVEALKQKIESYNMPEYLLSVQRTIMLKQIKQEKEEKWKIKQEKKNTKKKEKEAKKNK